MSEQLIRINLRDGDRQEEYWNALIKIRDVMVISEEGEQADALITQDWEEAMRSESPCLLLRPELVDPENLASLAGFDLRVFPEHLWRFFPKIRAVQESNEQGLLGEPGLLRVHHWPGTPTLMKCDSTTLEQEAFAQVDLACWMFGAAPDHVHALRPPNGIQMHFGFPGEAMALIDVAVKRPVPDDYYSLHLIGSCGAAYADSHRNAHLLFRWHNTQAVLEASDEHLAILNLVQEFVDGIRGKREWGVSLQDTLKATQLVNQMGEGA